MELAHKFLVEDRELSNYDEFKKNCKMKSITEFKFAYDIIDK